VLSAEWKKAIGYRPKAEGRTRRSEDEENRGKNVFLLRVAFFPFPLSALFIFPIAYSLKPIAFFY
jgi:hypothetical protein